MRESPQRRRASALDRGAPLRAACSSAPRRVVHVRGRATRETSDPLDATGRTVQALLRAPRTPAQRSNTHLEGDDFIRHSRMEAKSTVCDKHRPQFSTALAFRRFYWDKCALRTVSRAVSQVRHAQRRTAADRARSRVAAPPIPPRAARRLRGVRSSEAAQMQRAVHHEARRAPVRLLARCDAPSAWR